MPPSVVAVVVVVAVVAVAVVVVVAVVAITATPWGKSAYLLAYYCSRRIF